jgi:hypothetical protein
MVLSLSVVLARAFGVNRPLIVDSTSRMRHHPTLCTRSRRPSSHVPAAAAGAGASLAAVTDAV